MTITWKEIHAQHDAVLQAIQTVRGESCRIRRLFSEPLPSRILFLGCGSSFLVARSLASMAEDLLGIPARALPAGECLLHAERLGWGSAGTLTVAISRSGMTSELVLALRVMKQRHPIRVISLCMTENTEPGRESDLSLEFPWAYDHSVCQTRTVSTLYATGMMMLAIAAGSDGRNSRIAGADSPQSVAASESKALAEGLARAAAAGYAFMSLIEADCEAIGRLPWTNVVTLADAELGGICAEGALAFTEIAQTFSACHSVLDVRHGPMVKIRPDTLVIIAPSNPEGPLERGLLADLAKKGCVLVVVSDALVPPPEGLSSPECWWNLVAGQTLPHAARGLPFIQVCQLIAHAGAVHRGVNPDSPEGLNAWIRLPEA